MTNMNAQKIKTIVFCIFFIAIPHLHAQSASDDQRFSFAQMNFGIDVLGSVVQGSTSYLDSEGQLQGLSLSPTFRPRLLIGATHFWGHADFQIAIPVYLPSIEKENQEVNISPRVETIFKAYPFGMQNGGIRPYIGFSVAPFTLLQNNKNEENGQGFRQYFTRVPLHAGLTYKTEKQMLELGLLYNYDNDVDYYISPTRQVTIESPPLYAHFSYRFLLETTAVAGKTIADRKQQFKDEAQLDNFFIGIGMSSAWWLSQSTYNEKYRPYIPDYGISLLPDIAIGYYWHSIDANLTLATRWYNNEFREEAFGVKHELFRFSTVLEYGQNLFDYYGFVPFIGPAVSYERLSFEESGGDIETITEQENQFSYGITFGWDIRPNRYQFFILRTNLRWFPNLFLDVKDNTSINFNNIEFNFIQLIIYPSRISTIFG